MTANYLRVSQEELDAYIQDSSKLEDRIYNESDAPDPNLVDLDKAWDGIFFLLTGTSLSTIKEAKEPLSLTMYSTLEIDPEQDMGFGPAIYNTVEQVKEISAALDKITSDDLYSRYDAEQMTALGLYPEIWKEDDAIEYLIENFDVLKAFYNDAVSQNQAVLFFVN